MNENIVFKKKFGQNFLKDKNIVKKIINCVQVKPNSLVIEIGCGDGRLTKELCNNFDYLLGYEIDSHLKERLNDNLKGFDNKKIVFADFLNHNIKEDINDINYDNLYIIANLPYYITKPIIKKIIDEKLQVEQMVLMVQKEVANRLTSKEGNKDYGSLTVFLNYYFDIKKQFIVSRDSFIPVPNVDSTVVSFNRKDTKPYVNNEKLLFKLIKDSFKFKRKNLKNNLKEYDLIKVEEILKKYNFDLTVRAEYLSLDVFCDITNNLSI